MTAFETLETDVLILGAGGAGLFAALHASNAQPNLSVTVVVMALVGKCGCIRIVQGDNGHDPGLSDLVDHPISTTALITPVSGRV
mgnify:CR=1 FL=1